jgi:hypothetical protein
MKEGFRTMRDAGTYLTSTTLGESVRAFVPPPLPPVAPVLSLADFAAPNHAAELALAPVGRFQTGAVG